MQQKICFLLLVIMACQMLHGQSEQRVAGQWLVHAESDEHVLAIQQQWVSGRVSGSGSPLLKQIMKKPMSLWLMTCPGDVTSEQFWVRQIGTFKGIQGVYPNRYIRHRGWPDDPDVSRQWQYSNPGGNGGIANADIDMDQAWDLTTGGVTPSGDSIVICIIDDGINGMHEDMQPNLWFNLNEIPANGLDDDGNGYIDDIRGWNVTTSSDEVYTGGGHGTPVAGVAGAKGNNGKGVSGVNWNVKLMIVNYGNPTEANALASYGYAYTMRRMYNHTGGKKGAYIVATNASWGIDKAGSDEAPLWCALYDSLGTVGILSCGATTNTDTDVDLEGDLPTSCQSDFLLSVTNINRSDTKVTNAGYGAKSIDLGAYGQQIYTVTRTSYGSFGGTSGATPHVTGVLGLLYSLPCRYFDSLAHVRPEMAARIAKDAILFGSKPNNSMNQISTTGGVLNAYNSLQHIHSLCGDCNTAPLGVQFHPKDQAVIVDWPSSIRARMAVRYRRVGELEWIVRQDVVQGFLIGPLQNCSEYEFQVGSACGQEEVSFRVSHYVHTTGCCLIPVPASLTADSGSVSLVVNAQPDAQIWVSYSTDNQTYNDTLLEGRSLYLDGIAACNAVTFRMVSRCRTYDNVSDTSRQIRVTTPCGTCTEAEYCLFDKKDDTQEWIAAFTIAGSRTLSGSSGQGYTSQAGVSRIDFVPDNAYPFALTVGYASTPFPDFFNIFADFNQDGEFQEEEHVYSTPAPITEGINGVIYVPDSAKIGYTRMRLILSYEKIDMGCDSDEFEYGEVEDYCVYISDRACPYDAQVKWLSSDRESMYFAIAHQQAVPDSVIVRYRVKGSTQWNEVLAVDSIRISGLEECTLYEFSFRSLCGQIKSSPTAVDTFRTACSNQVVGQEMYCRIWPNPAAQQLNFQCDQANEGTMFKVVDILGNEWQAPAASGGQNLWKVDVKACKPGVYQLVYKALNGAVQQVRFVKTD